MTTHVKRLSAEDWERAALEAIAQGGLQAVAVEPLARRLKVTKGSFYAHFPDRDALVAAALRRWEAIHVEAFERSLEDAGDPEARLRSLVAMAAAAAAGPTIQGRLLLESDDPRVRAALQRVTNLRLERLTRIFRELGHGRRVASQRSTLAYAIYIGLLQLARETPERMPDEKALAAEVLSMLSQP